MKTVRAVMLAMFGLFAVLNSTPIVAQSVTTYTYSPQFIDGSNHALANITVKIYNHGAAENPQNVLATGITDANGFLQPGATLTIGNTYDFTTTSPKVPIGQFVAQAPRQLVLIPGPVGSTGPQGPPGPTASPLSIVPGSSNVTIGAPSPGVYSVAVATQSPAPTPSPVSVVPGSANVTVAHPSPGVFAVAVATQSPFPTPTPVSVVPASSNVTVTNPSPGVFAVGVATQAPGVSSVSGDGRNISTANSTTTPQVTITDSPTFRGREYLGTTGIYGDSGNTAAGVLSLSNGTGIGSGFTDILSSSNANNAVNGLQGRVLVISDENGSNALAAWDIDGSYSVYGSLFAGNLVSGKCLQAAANGKIVSTSAACGTGTGTVTSVTGDSKNVSVSNGTTTPQVTVTDSPTFPGQVTMGDAYIGTAGGSIGHGMRIGSSQGAAQQSIWLACPSTDASVECNLGGVRGTLFDAIAGGSAVSLFALDGTGALAVNSLTATNLTSGQCLQASTNGKIVGGTCGVASVGAGSNTSIGGTATNPTVGVISAPIFSGRVTSDDPTVAFYTGINNQTRSYVAQNTVSGSGNSNIGPAPSVTVAGVNANVWDFSEYDGNTLTANLAALDNNGNFGVAGALSSGTLTAGNCVQAGNNGKLVSSSAGCAFTMHNGTTLAGTHLETIGSVSVPASGSFTYTISSPYNAIPVCTAVMIGTGTPSISISSVTTSQVVIANSAASAVNAEAICIGW